MIRIPNLTNLSDPGQVAELMRLLKSIRNEQTRTSMPTESMRRKRDRPVDERRFRVVNNPAVPGDPNFGSQEVHFNIGGVWKRVKLEDL